MYLFKLLKEGIKHFQEIKKPVFIKELIIEIIDPLKVSQHCLNLENVYIFATIAHICLGKSHRRYIMPYFYTLGIGSVDTEAYGTRL